MPPLDNQRHERFAQGLAIGKSATEAYSDAGYAAHAPSASRLLTNANVLLRVEELKNRTAKRTEVTAASLIAEAEEIREKALEAKQFAAAIAAVKEKGVLSGHRVEKRDNTIRTLNEMSDDDLADIAAAGSHNAPAEAPRSTRSH